MIDPHVPNICSYRDAQYAKVLSPKRYIMSTAHMVHNKNVYNFPQTEECKSSLLGCHQQARKSRGWGYLNTFEVYLQQYVKHLGTLSWMHSEASREGQVEISRCRHLVQFFILSIWIIFHNAKYIIEANWFSPFDNNSQYRLKLQNSLSTAIHSYNWHTDKY